MDPLHIAAVVVLIVLGAIIYRSKMSKDND